MSTDTISPSLARAEQRTANEQIGALRNELHHVEAENRKLAEEVKRLKNELGAYLDVGDMALEACRFLAGGEREAKRIAERINDWWVELERVRGTGVEA